MKSLRATLAAIFLLMAVNVLAITGTISTAGSDCSVSTNCVVANLGPGSGGVVITVAGSFTGTLQFEAAGDGVTYAPINATPLNSTTAVTSATSTGTWQVNVAGLTNFRVRASALSGGTPSVSISYSTASARTNGGGGGGTYTGTSPIVVSGTAISCPTCGTNSLAVAGSSGDIQTNNGSANLGVAHLNDNATTMTVTESITPLVAAAKNLGTAPLPFGDGYFGGAANHSFHFDTSAVASNVAVVVPNAASNTVQGIANPSDSEAVNYVGTDGVQHRFTPTGTGANTTLSNLGSVALNASLIPGVAAAENLGTAPLPFGDLFVGGAANHSFHFDTSAVASNVAVAIPNHASNTVQGIANPSDTNVVNYIGTDGVQNRIAQSGGGGVTSIQPSNNGTPYGSPLTGAITINFANCIVSATFTITCPAGGSGTVNSGTATHLAYYATSTTAVSDMGADYTFLTHTLTQGTNGILNITGTFNVGGNTMTFPGTAATLLYSGGALGTPSSGSAANLSSFPTLNQATTGAAWTGTYTPAANKVLGGATPASVTVTSSYVDNSIALTGTDINTSNQVTTTHLASALPVLQGGTGVTAGSASKVLGGATPSYVTVTSSYVDNSIALTGTDINTSNQVTATHLAAALPVAQGGTALTSGTAGKVLGGATPSMVTITSSYVDSSIALTANPLSQFAATTSAQLAGVISDETGSGGGLVFATGPTLSNPIVGTQTQLDGSTKAASTLYVDTAVSNAVAGVNPAVAVLAASTANVVGTYSNGVAGIGATFTVTATGTFTLDGIAINTIGQRVLLKDQSTGFQNGMYTVTIPGSVGVSPIFTRALDYDTPSDINSTGAIPVQSGTVNTTTSWLLTSAVTTVGTDALTYVKFSVVPSSLVLNNQANTYSTGDQNFTSATNMELPNTQAGAAATSTTDQGGQDVTGAATGTQGGKTIRGADISNAAGNATNTAGGVTIRGGDNANLGTGGSVEAAGSLTIRPGAPTDGASGTDSVPGYLVISQTYRKGATYTAAGSPTGGLIGTLTGHNTISDISANPYNWLGVNLPAINTTGANEQMMGIVTVRAHASTAFVNGDIVCTDTTNYGYVIDSGTSPCSCPSTQVGLVDLTFTATTALITLVHQGACVPTVAASASKMVDYIDPTTGAAHQATVTSAYVDTSICSNAACGQNTTGTAANVSGTPSLPNGTTATSQAAGDNTTKLATDAFVTAAIAPIGPTVNTAVSDPICEVTNTPYTCTGVSTTETYFATKTTIPTAGTANLIDGTHHGLNLSTIFDIVAASTGGSITLKLNACTSLSSQTCSGRVTLWSGATASAVGAVTATGQLINCLLLPESTATTLNVSCVGSAVKTFAPVISISSVTASVPNTGTNWVLAWSITFGTAAQNNAAALTAQVATLIP